MAVGMDGLPVELLRLIFEFCDASTVQALRLVSASLADVGCEYLIAPTFTSVGWRDDITRLHSISAHPRLRGSVQSVNFNVSRISHYGTRRSSFVQHWTAYSQLEKEGLGPPSLISQSTLVDAALSRLPHLRNLKIICTLPLLRSTPGFLDPLSGDNAALLSAAGKHAEHVRAEACRDITAVVVAAGGTRGRLTNLTVDPLPLEVFRAAADTRRAWFACARGGALANLTRLRLTIVEPPVGSLLPAARFRALNGLGHVLQQAPAVTRLHLAFRTTEYRARFPLSFSALLGVRGERDFVFARLADLHVDGVSCAEDDLRGFLLRHAGSLHRLRLGGDGSGGLRLHEGSLKLLLTSLRGRLSKLERFHLEGLIQTGGLTTSSRENYHFHAMTDDDWNEISEDKLCSFPASVDSLAFERYLLRGGEYPKCALEI